ncbi:MAG TPA: glycosyl hydrolase, partial [Gemmatimonadaceae bacterium]|nr:glycosyl hydrolase [Gemmatimonadaceae bacterium]
MRILSMWALVAWASVAQAQPKMQWRLVGPFRGGRALAIEGIAGDPATFYFGGVGGGVWRSGNAGRTWEAITDGQTFASIGALALAPSDPRVMYVGAGEADMRSDITYGNGMWKSADAGNSWTHLGLDSTRQIARILVDPRDPNTLLVAALGHAYGPNPDRGVYRSTDGGQTWQKVLFRNDRTGAIDLAWDPKDPHTVYAALWETHRPPWSQYPPIEGPGGGVFKSTDEGLTWTELSGLPKDGGPIGLATVKGVVYAICEGKGLFRSDDGGSTWRQTSTDPRLGRGWYFGQVFVDPSNPDVVYAPNVAILRSTDGGKTFTAIKGNPGGDDYHYMWIDPANSRHVAFASDQGVGVSFDYGATWSEWFNQPTAQFYHVITDNRWPYWIYGAQQDAGSMGVVSRSDYGAITYRDWMLPGAGESGMIALDPLDSNIIYGGNTYGGLLRFDRTTNVTEDIQPWPRDAFGVPIDKRKYRFTWTSPLVFDPIDKRTLYFGSQRLLKTTDGGLSWQLASPALTRSDSGVIYAVAPSPKHEGIVWAGADDGRIQVTLDRGLHWRNVTPPDLAPWSKASIIDASPLDSATAYVAIDRHRLDDIAPYIYRTHDLGAHWSRADQGIPFGAYVRA